MKRLIIMTALLMLLSHMGGAAEPAFVELVPPDNHTPWVGQRVVVAVDVVVEGRFSGSTLFDLPQVSGVILMKPEERPVLSTRTIDDTEYTVQRHEFALFCQKDGKITIPGFRVRCGSTKGYGQPVQEHTLDVPSLNVTVKLPPGSKKGQIVVTATDFDVSETWTPFPDKAKVGDAFERTITMRAVDVPGMMLPTIRIPKAKGLAVYRGNPHVSDQTERGEFIGQRIETLTYICEAKGGVEIPAFQVRWWKPSKSAWEEKVLPAVTLKVTATAAQGLSAAGGKVGWVSWYWPVGLILAAVACVLGWIMIRKRRPEAETILFKECLQACREGDAFRAYNAVTQWRTAACLSHVAPLQSVDVELKTAQRVIVGLDTSWEGRPLAAALKYWRRVAQRNRGRMQGVLPELNPSG